MRFSSWGETGSFLVKQEFHLIYQYTSILITESELQDIWNAIRTNRSKFEGSLDVDRSFTLW